jgi:hypothetical protein
MYKITSLEKWDSETGSTVSRICRFCPKEIWSNTINGHIVYFEDAVKTVPHIHAYMSRNGECAKDHVLLTQTITRVSDLERQIETIRQKLSV